MNADSGLDGGGGSGVPPPKKIKKKNRPKNAKGSTENVKPRASLAKSSADDAVRSRPSLAKSNVDDATAPMPSLAKDNSMNPGSSGVEGMATAVPPSTVIIQTTEVKETRSTCKTIICCLFQIAMSIAITAVVGFAAIYGYHRSENVLHSKLILERHNYYRSIYGSPLLKNNITLESNADFQLLAYVKSLNYSTTVGYPFYDNGCVFNETVFHAVRFYFSGYYAVRSMFDGHREYDYNSTQCVHATNDTKVSTRCDCFTQLMWKATTNIGCAITRTNDFSFIGVCHYYPIGNVKEHYKDNVPDVEGPNLERIQTDS